MENQKTPDRIKIRGGRVHNLKNIDVDIPLNKIVGIAGVSGSGKSSLALGILYAEGSRRYLESLSTYTRRRMTQAEKAQVDEVLYVPAALALRQRPGVPGIRSTFGTGTELLNSLRLMFSRLSSHRCPNGHYVEPSLNVAAGLPLVCPTCGEHFFAPSAEELAFNSQGACKKCDGTGIVCTVDEATLVPDESLSIDEGAVAPWQTLMWSLMKDIASEMGVRTDVPFHVRSTVATYADVHDELRKVFARTPDAKERGYKAGDFSYNTGKLRCPTCDGTGSINLDVQFLPDVEIPCPDCGGSRYAKDASLIRRIPKQGGQANTLPELMDMSVDEALTACADIPLVARRLRVLQELGLGYMTLGEETPSFSGGEAQRLKLASEMGKGQSDTVFVFDEPTIGLHPLDVETLLHVFERLIENKATVIVIEHDLDVIKNVDYVVDMGPDGGIHGGEIIAAGTPEEICGCESSKTGAYLKLCNPFCG